MIMVFRTARGQSAHVGSEEVGVSSRRVSSACSEGKVLEIRDIHGWGNGRLCGYHQSSCGFVSHGFDTRGYFIFWFYSNRLRGCSMFRLRLLMLGRLPGNGHRYLLGRRRDRLRSGIGISGRSCCLENMPPRTTLLYSPKSTCSAEGPARLAS